MAETYCGKSCAECSAKEVLACPGCKCGPGRQYGGDCTLAKCVRDKGHETCGTCVFRGNCAPLRGRDSMPDYRRRRQEAESLQKAEIARRGPVLGKWLWLLFWLVVPGAVAELMANETTAKLLPGLYMPGLILNALVSGTYGLILLKLSQVEERYRKAGICTCIAWAASTAVVLAAGASDVPAWTLLVTIPAALVSLIGEYHEYAAHGAVLLGVDNALSGKWDILWKWYIGLLAGLLGSLLLMLLIPTLGLLVLLAASIGSVVVGILKLVYLYRTAVLFRDVSL